MDSDVRTKSVGLVFPAGEPFLLPPGPLPTTRNTRCGRGTIVPVSAQAGKEVTLQHQLGRKVVAMQVLANGPDGTLYPPRIRRTEGVSTLNAQSIMAEADLVGAFIFVW